MCLIDVCAVYRPVKICAFCQIFLSSSTSEGLLFLLELFFDIARFPTDFTAGGPIEFFECWLYLVSSSTGVRSCKSSNLNSDQLKFSFIISQSSYAPFPSSLMSSSKKLVWPIASKKRSVEETGICIWSLTCIQSYDTIGSTIISQPDGPPSSIICCYLCCSRTYAASWNSLSCYAVISDSFIPAKLLSFCLFELPQRNFRP